MPSVIGWLAYSDEERRSALDVIQLFSDRDTRDELGLGSIRDGFADHFFPGTSTIQTRAKYFLLIPWIYRRIEDRRAGTEGIRAHARKEEVKLIDALLASGDTSGVIGSQARGRLKRLPSEVYWQGLRAWGIRTFPGSRDQYHRQIERGLPSQADEPSAEDDSPDIARWSGWHSNLPTAPAGFPTGATLALDPEDSDYLSERILSRASGTLLAWLVKNAAPTDWIPFPWLHPQVDELPAQLRESLRHAQHFSDAIWSAPLLYNLMLAERREISDLVSEYRAALEEWAQSLAIGGWDADVFWEVVASTPARVDPQTRSFVRDWLAVALDEPSAVADNVGARDLILRREITVKRGQARLKSDRALALWGGAAGTAQIDFRWSTAQTMLSDIQAGRGASSDA